MLAYLMNLVGNLEQALSHIPMVVYSRYNVSNSPN